MDCRTVSPKEARGGARKRHRDVSSRYTIVLYGSDGLVAAEFDSISAMANRIGCRRNHISHAISMNRHGRPTRITWGRERYEIYLLRK